jgi:hypothetical protein
MPESLAREIGLLRTLARHLEWRPLPFERLTQELLRREGLGHLREKAGGITSTRVPGHHAFTELTNCLSDRLPAIERGAVYADIQTELFNFIENYVGREPSTVGSKDAEALVANFEKRFADRTSPRRVFVPCVISRTSAPRFEIGPVTFEFIDRVTTSDFYPHGGGDAALGRRGFDDLVRGCGSGIPLGWRAFP